MCLGVLGPMGWQMSQDCLCLVLNLMVDIGRGYIHCCKGMFRVLFELLASMKPSKANASLNIGVESVSCLEAKETL